jgi:hypothetical protein
MLRVVDEVAPELAADALAAARPGRRRAQKKISATTPIKTA